MVTPVDFEVGARVLGERTVITVAGDLDVLTAPRLRDQLVDVIDGGDREILVDLTSCESSTRPASAPW